MEYKSLIEKKNSDIFLLLLTFLLEKCPFTKDYIDLFMLNENLSPAEIKARTPEILSHMIASPTLDSHIMSSTLKKEQLLINKKIVFYKILQEIILNKKVAIFL